MSGSFLEFENPIRDAISRIRFAPQSNNLLISSWDSHVRLYDVDASIVRFEAPGEASIMDCCFQNELIAFSAASDGTITRYDLCSGIHDEIATHDDIATCVQYSDETCQVISAGWDRKIMSKDTRMTEAFTDLAILNSEVDSMSLCRFNLMVAAGELVNMYDLRNLRRPVQSKESCLGFWIKCICSIPHNCEGFAVGTVDGRVTLKIPNSSSSDDQGYTFRCHPKSRSGKDYFVSVNDIVFDPCMPGVFVTGNSEGYVVAWDAQKKRRHSEFKRCPCSVASLSYNSGGQLLAAASSYTYQDAKETGSFASSGTNCGREEPPKIFVHKTDSSCLQSNFPGSSSG